MTTTGQNIEALVERVDNQGIAIRGLAEESTTANRDLRAETSRVVSELSTNIKANETKFEAQIRALDVKLDTAARLQAEQSRPQYFALFGGMIAAVGLAVTIIQWQSGLRDKPIDDKLITLTQSIGDLARTTTTAFSEVKQSTVSQGEFRLTTDFEKQLADLRAQAGDVRRQLFQDRVEKLDNNSVTKGEEAIRWAAESKVNGDMQSDIKELTRRFDDLSPANNTLRDLAARQLELDAKIGFLKQSLIPTGSIIAKPN